MRKKPQQPFEFKKDNSFDNRLQVKFEVKQILEEDEKYFRFEGLASTWEVDQGGDRILPGAFVKSLTSIVPVILWQHNRYSPIGMPEEVKETPEGLYIRAKLPKSDDLVKGRVIPQVEVGSISAMSIGYRAVEWSWEEDVRILKQVVLREVSLVTFPMNTGAKVTSFKSDSFLESLGLTQDQENQLKSYVEDKQINVEDLKFLDDSDLKSRRDFENSLRESGLFSKNASVKLASCFNLSESNQEDTDNEKLLAEIKGFSDSMNTAAIKSNLRAINAKTIGAK